MDGLRIQPGARAMTKTSPALFVQVRRDKEKPLFRQIADQIRNHVTGGVLPVGSRLPGVRSLAGTLSVSEDTVSQAYATLLEEAVIEARPRSGYFIAKKLALTGSTPHPSVYQKFPAGMPARNALMIEEARRFFERTRSGEPVLELLRGAPALEGVEQKQWIAEAARFARSPWLQQTGAQSQGDLRLRRIIAARLRELRGIACEAESIVVTTGMRQSLALALQLVLTQGEAVLLESPSAPEVSAQLFARGLRAVWGRVDGQGLVFDADEARKAGCRCAIVSDASQMPLSIAMARSRKKGMLIWARTSGAVIIENDEGALLSRADPPEMPLRAAPFGEECVVYCGGFDQIVPPACAIAFLIAPKGLEQAFAGAAMLSGSVPPLSEQRTLAAFLGSEAFDGHLRRVRALARQRSSILQEMLGAVPEKIGRLQRAENGTLACFVLEPEHARLEKQLAKALALTPVSVLPLARFAQGPDAVAGLVFNFLAGSESEFLETAGALVRALQNCGGQTV